MVNFHASLLKQFRLFLKLDLNPVHLGLEDAM
jgi:hypothetical protein